MGTSKGYIAPTRPEWSASKRAVSSFLKNRDSDSKAKAVSKFSEALSTNANIGVAFSSSVGNLLSFARGVVTNGLDDTLLQFGRNDLLGKEPAEILSALIEQFTNYGATIEEALTADALSAALDELEITTPEDLARVEIDLLLKEMVTAFINSIFDLHYHEKVEQGRTPAEARAVLDEIHKYIADTLHDKLTPKDLQNIDLGRLNASSVVSATLQDAFKTFSYYYGDNSL